MKWDSLESLKYTPSDGGWFCGSASTLGFLPSAPVWRGVEGNGMCYPECRLAWIYKASETTEVSESRSWRDASKGLELASRKCFMQERGPSECGPMYLRLSPSVLEKVKWSIFFKRLTSCCSFKILTTKQELNMGKKSCCWRNCFRKSGGYSRSLQCLLSVLDLSKLKAKIFTVLTLTTNSTMSAVFFQLFISCLFWIVLQIFVWRAQNDFAWGTCGKTGVTHLLQGVGSGFNLKL